MFLCGGIEEHGKDGYRSIVVPTSPPQHERPLFGIVQESLEITSPEASNQAMSRIPSAGSFEPVQEIG